MREGFLHDAYHFLLSVSFGGVGREAGQRKAAAQLPFD